MSAVLQAKPSPLPPGPIPGPAAWKGPGIAGDRDWLYELSAADLAEIDAAVRNHFAEGREMGAITPATFRLPQVLQAKLAGLLDQVIHGRGFVMLRGFPVHQYTTAESAVAYLGIGSHLGSFRSQNAKGHLLGHVCDLGLDIRKPTTRYYQTNRELEYHTDSCDIVGLLCLKTSKSGGREPAGEFGHAAQRNPAPPAGPVARTVQPVPHGPARRGAARHAAVVRAAGVQLARRASSRRFFAGQYIRSAQANFPEARRLTAAEHEALDLARHAVQRPGAQPDHRVPARRHAVRAQPPDPAQPHRLRGLARTGQAPAPAAPVAGPGGRARAAARLCAALRFHRPRATAAASSPKKPN